MPLWTFIIDYDGGTYISQYAADTITEAFSLARQNGDKFLSLIDEDRASDATPIEGVQNVFCTGGIYKKKGILVNIIKTSQ
jgi:hypothetical protein